MFHGLRCRNQRGIKHRLLLNFAGDVVGFFNDAVDCRAVHALRLFADQLKNLFQPLYVIFGLAQMTLKTLLELRIGGFFDHIRQRFHDLLLGVVDVAQGMHEQVVHAFDVFGEQSHGVWFLCFVGVGGSGAPAFPGIRS
jgi:hypothetical protein